MHRSNRRAYENVQQYLFDIITIIVSYIISYFIAKQITHLFQLWEYAWILIVYIPLWMFCMYNSGMYNLTTFMYYDRLLRNILMSCLISGMFSAAMIFFIKEIFFSRILFGSFIAISLILLICERFTYTYIISKHSKIGMKNVIIIGNKAIADKFIYYISKTRIRINIVGFIFINSKKSLEDQDNLGALEEIDKILKEEIVDEVIFTVPKNYVSGIEKYVLICEEMGITVNMVLDLYDLKLSRTNLTSIGTLPMVTFHTISLNNFQLFVKRTMDILGALTGLLITAVLSIFIIPAIKLDSNGPVLFKQVRVGKKGRKFLLYKFRTMSSDAEGKKEELISHNQVEGNLMFKIKNDPRVTRVGKLLRSTSIDELPQFINVLKGDMSLVGTRPPTIDEVNQYENHHWRRISIKPGITGMWQVNGRSNITDFNEVVKLDTEYIDNWSVWLDIKIILKTIHVLFEQKGAY